MADLYEPTEEERLVALELLSDGLLSFRMDRYNRKDEKGYDAVMRHYVLANALHNVPTFLMGRMGEEQAREHLEYLEKTLPERMAGARDMLRQRRERAYKEDRLVRDALGALLEDDEGVE